MAFVKSQIIKSQSVLRPLHKRQLLWRWLETAKTYGQTYFLLVDVDEHGFRFTLARGMVFTSKAVS